MATAWLDEDEVLPEWAPPAGEPVRRYRFRDSLVYAAILVSLALVVGLLHLTGGFGRRTDLPTPVAAGTLITTGPFELSFTEATAQPRTDYDETPGWEVVVIGLARTTGEETDAPSTFGDDGLFVLRDPATTRTELPYGTTIGPPSDALRDRRHLAPGLPATDYRVTFRLPADYVPGTTIDLGVADLVFESKYLTTDEKTWDNGLHGYRVELPVRVLAAEPT